MPLTPIEEFVHNSHTLKSQMLDEALKENAILRDRIAELESEISASRKLVHDVSSKLMSVERVVGHLTEQYQQFVESQEAERKAMSAALN
jgi:chromosome segregation ATPase